MDYSYNGLSSNSKSELCKELKISIRTITDMEAKGTSFYESLDIIIEGREENRNLLIEATNFFDKEFTSVGELNKYLSYIGVKRSSGVMTKEANRFKLYRNLVNTPYKFLVVRTESFEYLGIEYTSLLKFCNHYKLLINTLYEELLKNNFDVKKSILLCENDPHFRATVRPVIGDQIYSSIAELCREYGIISVGGYSARLREGMSFEEALSASLESQNYINKFEEEFPIIINKKEYCTMSSISEALGIGLGELYKKIDKYNSVKEVIESWSPKELILDKFHSLDEFAENYGVPKTSLKKLLDKFNRDLEQVKSYLDGSWFVYKDKRLLPVAEHLRPYGITTSASIAELRVLLKDGETLEERSTIATNYLENINRTKLQTSSIFKRD